MILLVLLAWAVASVPVALVLGKMIRSADEAATPARSAHYTDWAQQ